MAIKKEKKEKTVSARIPVSLAKDLKLFKVDVPETVRQALQSYVDMLKSATSQTSRKSAE